MNNMKAAHSMIRDTPFQHTLHISCSMGIQYSSRRITPTTTYYCYIILQTYSIGFKSIRCIPIGRRRSRKNQLYLNFNRRRLWKVNKPLAANSQNEVPTTYALCTELCLCNSRVLKNFLLRRNVWIYEYFSRVRTFCLLGDWNLCFRWLKTAKTCSESNII